MRLIEQGKPSVLRHIPSANTWVEHEKQCFNWFRVCTTLWNLGRMDCYVNILFRGCAQSTQRVCSMEFRALAVHLMLTLIYEG